MIWKGEGALCNSVNNVPFISVDGGRAKRYVFGTDGVKRSIAGRSVVLGAPRPSSSFLFKNRFDFAINMRRASTSIHLMSSLPHLHSKPHHSHIKWIPLLAASTATVHMLPHPWQTPLHGFAELLHLMPIPTIRVNKYNTPTCNGSFHTISTKHISLQPPTIHRYKRDILYKLHQAPLPLSKSQVTLFSTCNTAPRQLFRALHHTPLRPHIRSFIWKLLHNTLHLHLYDTCPLCQDHNPNTSHFFTPNCDVLHKFSTTRPLQILLTPPHTPNTISHAALHLWTLWKLLCAVNHGNINNNEDSLTNYYNSVYLAEKERFKLANL